MSMNGSGTSPAGRASSPREQAGRGTGPRRSSARSCSAAGWSIPAPSRARRPRRTACPDRTWSRPRCRRRGRTAGPGAALRPPRPWRRIRARGRAPAGRPRRPRRRRPGRHPSCRDRTSRRGSSLDREAGATGRAAQPQPGGDPPPGLAGGAEDKGGVVAHDIRFNAAGVGRFHGSEADCLCIRLISARWTCSVICSAGCGPTARCSAAPPVPALGAALRRRRPADPVHRPRRGGLDRAGARCARADARPRHRRGAGPGDVHLRRRRRHPRPSRSRAASTARRPSRAAPGTGWAGTTRGDTAGGQRR